MAAVPPSRAQILAATRSSGGVLQTGVEVALGLQVEQGPHGLDCSRSGRWCTGRWGCSGAPRCRGCSQRGCTGCLSGNLAWVCFLLGFDRISPARLQKAGNRLGTKYYTAFPGLWSIPRRKVRESFPAWILRIGYHGHPWESMGFGEGFSALPALRGTGFYLPWVGSGTKCERNTRRKRANALAILPLSIMIRTHAAPAVPGIGKP